MLRADPADTLPQAALSWDRIWKLNLTQPSYSSPLLRSPARPRTRLAEAAECASLRRPAARWAAGTCGARWARASARRCTVAAVGRAGAGSGRGGVVAAAAALQRAWIGAVPAACGPAPVS